jgi:hypothetical protein
MSATKEYYHDEIEKQTRIMNKLQLQFKGDTGQRPLIEIESESAWDIFENQYPVIPVEKFPTGYKVYVDIVIPSPEYVAWLEEKVEAMQKLPTNNI